MACNCNSCSAREAGANETSDRFETDLEASEARGDDPEAGLSEEHEHIRRFPVELALDPRRMRRVVSVPAGVPRDWLRRIQGLPRRPRPPVAPGFRSAFQRVAFVPTAGFVRRDARRFVSPIVGAPAPPFRIGAVAAVPPGFASGVPPQFLRQRRGSRFWRDLGLLARALIARRDRDGDAAADPDSGSAPPTSPADVESPDLGLVAAQAGPVTDGTAPATEAELPSTGHCRLDSTISEVTLYQPIALGIAGVPNETAIYLPPGLRRDSTVDVVVYFHGWETNRSGNVICGRARTIAEYLRDPQFALREVLRDSHRNAILVAPKLGPQSQAGALGVRGGFPRFLDQVLGALAGCGAWASPPQVGQLVMAAHSGGGEIVSGILSRGEAANLAEVWMFDAVYGQVAAWKRFLATHPNVVARFAYTAGTSANHRAIAAGARGPHVEIAPTRAPDHCHVPRGEMPRYLTRSRLRSRTEG